MTDLDVFLPLVMQGAPGCAEPAAKQAIIKAAREFCERTRIWRDSDTFQVTPTSCNVVCTPADADLFEIEFSTLDNKPLQPISYSDLNHEIPNWRSLTSPGRWITQIERGTVMVVPAVTGTLFLSTILIPSEEAEQLPDFLAKDYRRAIVDGALAEVLMLPAQSFSAPDRAQFYSARFEQRISQLFNRNIKGQQKAPARTRGSFF